MNELETNTALPNENIGNFNMSDEMLKKWSVTLNSKASEGLNGISASNDV